MAKGFFITGTDTDAGKSYITSNLLHAFNKKGFKTAGIKPIATGCQMTCDGLRNADALLLQQAASLNIPYHQINPFAFVPPIAPHIAAAQNNTVLKVENVSQACQPVLDSDADVILIEGAGGWLVPLNDTETMGDLAKYFNFPIILVVGMKLGCINHTLLTWHYLQLTGLKIAGWIANCIDPYMQMLNENIATLEKRLSAIPLTVVKHNDQIDLAVIDMLINTEF